MSKRPLTVLFMPESAYGPTNNCVGIGHVLRGRGHRVVEQLRGVTPGDAVCLLAG